MQIQNLIHKISICKLIQFKPNSVNTFIQVCISINMNIPAYVILLIIIGGISITTALAVTETTEDITVDRSGANAILHAKANNGNAVIKMTDVGTASFAFTVFDNTGRFDITDIFQGQLRLSVTSNGNVGIGTGTPIEKLDVIGNIRLTGNIVSPNDICIGTCT